MTIIRNGTMRAAVLTQPHGDLSIEQIPIPEPKSGQVLVKVAGCGVCHTDLHVIKEEVVFPMPCVLGHEISGTVEVVAPMPRGRAPGWWAPLPCRAVAVAFCARGRDDLCERFFALNRLKGCPVQGLEAEGLDHHGPPASWRSTTFFTVSTLPGPGRPPRWLGQTLEGGDIDWPRMGTRFRGLVCLGLSS